MDGPMYGGGEIREVIPPKYQEFVDSPSTTLVSLNGLQFVVPDKCQTNAISQYDLNSDGQVDGADAYFAGVAPNERRDWIIENLRNDAYICGEDTAWIDQMRDIANAFTLVRRSYEMVDVLRQTKHKDDPYFNFGHRVDREYTPRNWRQTVLPAIGDAGNYTWMVEGAAYVFRKFASRYGIGQTNSGSAEDLIDTVIYLDRLDPAVRGAAGILTAMMSSVVHFADNTQIECEGNGCPQDDESGAIDTDLTSTLCYVMERDGDATCYDPAINPSASAMAYVPFAGEGIPGP